MLDILPRMLAGMAFVAIVIAFFAAFSVALLVLLVVSLVGYGVLWWRMRRAGWQGSRTAWMQQWMMRQMAQNMNRGTGAQPKQPAAPSIEGEYFRLDATDDFDAKI